MRKCYFATFLATLVLALVQISAIAQITGVNPRQVLPPGNTTVQGDWNNIAVLRGQRVGSFTSGTFPNLSQVLQFDRSSMAGTLRFYGGTSLTASFSTPNFNLLPINTSLAAAVPTSFGTSPVTSWCAPAFLRSRYGTLLYIGRADGTISTYNRTTGRNYVLNTLALGGIDVGTNAQVRIVDLDVDNNDDFLISNGDGVIRHFEFVSGTYQDRGTIKTAAAVDIDGGDYMNFDLYDIDDNQRLDLVYVGDNGVLMRCEQSGLFSTTFTTPTGISHGLGVLSSVHLLDMNNDGTAELLATRNFDGQVVQASLTGSMPVTVTLRDDNFFDNDFGARSKIASTDVNADGKLDFLIGNNFTGELTWYEQTVGPIVTSLSPASPNAACETTVATLTGTNLNLVTEIVANFEIIPASKFLSQTPTTITFRIPRKGIQAVSYPLVRSATSSQNLPWSLSVFTTFDAPAITATSFGRLCANTSVQLSVPTAQQYMWSTGATTQSITVTEPGIYTVRINNGNFCWSDEGSFEVTKSVIPALKIGQINNYLGTGSAGDLNSPIASVRFSTPYDIRPGSNSNTFIITDNNNHKIKLFNSSTNTLTTLAGTGSAGYVDGSTTTARFNFPTSAIQAGPNLIYVADYTNGCIREINTATNTVSTLVGNGTWGDVDGNAPATARIRGVMGMAIASNGDLFFTDYNNHKIKKLSGGVVTTVAGSTVGDQDGTGSGAKLRNPTGIAIDADGNIWFTELGNHKVKKMTPAGVVTTVAGGAAGFADGTLGTALFNQPAGIMIATDQTVFVADFLNSRIRRISTTGEVSTVAGNATTTEVNGIGTSASLSRPWGGCIDQNGRILYTDRAQNKIKIASPFWIEGITSTNVSVCTGDVLWGVPGYSYSWNSGSVTQRGLVPLNTGTYSLQVSNGTCISPVTTTINVTMVSKPSTLTISNAGTSICNGIPVSLTASALSPSCTYLWSNGATTQNISVTTPGVYTVRQVHTNGCSSDLSAAVTVTQGSLPSMTAAGVTTLIGSSSSVLTGSANGAAGSTTFNNPTGVAFVPGTSVTTNRAFIADAGNRLIRYFDGINTSTYAGLGGSPALADGANTTTARFLSPNDVLFVSQSELYVADGSAIRLVTPSVTGTIAGSATQGYQDGSAASARFSNMRSLARTANGNLYIADAGNHCIRLLSGTTVSTFAGTNASGYVDGNASTARFNNPHGVATDADGNIYVADAGNHCIRKITPAGVVSTLAGNGTGGFADGTGSAARFNFPTGVSVDLNGIVYVADRNNRRIRRISPTGDVTTLIGSSVSGFANGIGASGSLNLPIDVTADRKGSLIVADQGNNNIRLVLPVWTNVQTTGTSFCSGTNITAISGYEYSWSTGATTQSIAPTTSNIYTVSIISNGCTSAVSYPVNYTITTTPDVPVITSSSNTTLCQLSPTTLTAPTMPGGSTYLWSTGETTQSISVASPGTSYTVRTITGTCTSAVSAPVTLYYQNDGNPPMVSTLFSGSGFQGFSNGSFSNVSFRNPSGITTYNAFVWVADRNNHSIRIFEDNTGTNTNSIGVPTSGYVNSTTLSSIRFNSPRDVIASTANTGVFVADFGNNAVRLINANTGATTTFAGSATGVSGFTNGTGTGATFNGPSGFALFGNILYVADRNNHAIRAINISSAAVTTLAGSGTAGSANGTGTAATFNEPVAIAVGPDGTLYVSEAGSHRIRRVTAAGVVTTLAGSGTAGFVNGTGTAASFNSPAGMAVIRHDLLLVADLNNHCIRQVNLLTGQVTTFHGTNTSGNVDGNATTARYNQPTDLFLGFNNTLFVADGGNHVIKTLGPDYITANTSLCSGGSISAPSGYNYLWNTNETAQTISTPNPRLYYVRLGTNGCNSLASARVRISVNSVPPAPIITTSNSSNEICPGTGITLSANFRPSATYLWSNGATTQSIFVTSPGTFSVRMVVNTCTTLTSAPVTVTLASGGPVITSLSASSVSPGGTIDIVGSSLNTTTGVRLNDQRIPYLLVNSTRLRLTIPYNAFSGVFTVISSTGCHAVSPPVAVARNSTSFNFQSLSSGISSISTSSSVYPSLVDLDANNRHELVISDNNLNYTYLYSQSAPFSNTFNQVATNFATNLVSPPTRKFSFADFDGDGLLEALVNAGSTSLILIEQAAVGSNSFVSVNSDAIPGLTSFSYPTIADLDRNGLLDVLVADGTTTIMRYEQAGYNSTSFLSRGPMVFPGYSGTQSAPLVLDLDSDGLFEVALTPFSSFIATDDMSIYEQTALGSLTFTLVTTIPDMGYATTFGDTDGDGLIEIVAGRGNFIGCNHWEQQQSPRISSLSENSICVGRTLTITGLGFTGTTAVTINGVAATHTLVNATTITVPITSSMASGPVVVTAAFGTSNALPVTITTEPAPTLTGTNTICTGQSTTLTAASGISLYQWTSDGGTNWTASSASNTLVVSPTANITYNVRGITSTGCTTAVSTGLLVTVNQLPTTPTITSGGTICTGGSFTLTGPTGLSFYQWSSNGGSNWTASSSLNTISVSPTGTTNYVLRVINANSCTSAISAAVTVTVNIPPAAPTITGATTVCQGTNVTLTATSGYTNYQWSSDGGSTWSTASTSNTQIVSPASTTNYVVRGNNASGCYSLASAQATVTINLPPVTPTITGAGAICPGGSITLTATAGQPGYQWSTNGGTNWSSTQSVNTYVVNPTVATNYVVRSISAQGCTSAISSAASVTMNPVPTTPAITSGAASICPGTDYTLVATTGFSTYQWSSNGGANWTTASASNTLLINVSTATNYIVRVTNSSGCLSANSGSVAISMLPKPGSVSGFMSLSTSTICPGASATLNISLSPFAEYQLSTDAGVTWPLSNTVNGSFVLSPTVTTSYVARVRNSSGCWSNTSSALTLNVHPLPSAPTVTGAGTYCQGSNVTLTATSGFNSYQISSNGGTNWSSIGASNSTTVSPASTTTYLMRYVNAQGCTSAASSPVVININPRPSGHSITGGGVSICNGSSVLLTGTSGYSFYEWTSNGGTNWTAPSASNTINVSPTANTNYALRVTNANGCVSFSSGVATITVNQPLSVPSITGSSSVCVGSSVTLTATTGLNNYQWTSDGGATWTTATTSNTISVSPSSNTNYQVRSVSSAGCASAASTAFALSTLTPPASPPSISGFTSVCQGTNVTLNATPGFTFYQWSSNGGANWSSASGSSSISFTIGASSVSYLVRGSNATGCYSIASTAHNVTPNLLPATPTITGTSSHCSGNTLTLTATAGGFNYQWTSDGGTNWTTASTSNILSGVPSFTGFRSYQVRIISAAGCTSAVASFGVTVNVTPNTPTITGDNATCLSRGVRLTGPPNQGSYQYSTDGGTNWTTPTFSNYSDFYPPVGTTTFLLRTYNSAINNCTSAVSAPFVVTVNPNPTTPTISGATTVCQGTTVTLTATAGFSTYDWSTNGGINWTTSGGSNTFNVNPSTTTNYVVRAVNSIGCTTATSSPATVTINVPPTTPSITAGGPTTFCAGGSVTLTAPAGFGYMWSTNQTTQSITVSTAGSYTVRTIASGCTSAASAATVVSVTPLPTTPSITAGGPTTFCAGGSVTLTAPAGFAYLWSTGATTQSISPTTAGSYTVRTIASGCTSVASAATVVSVTPLPTTPSITAGGPTTFCAGGSVTLTAPAGFTYLWSTNETTQSITVNAAGSYTVRTIASGCTSAASAATVVSVTPLPTTPSITAGGPTTFCAGGSVTLTAPAGFTYLWSTNETTQSITVSTAGSYTVRTIASGCTSAASAATVVSVTPLPTTPSITAGGPTTFCAGGSVTLTAPAGFTYLWSTNETTQSITVNAAGSYTVRTIASGCTSAASAATVVSVTPLPTTPTITAGGPTTFCAGGSVTLTAPAGFSYIWSTGATTQSISPTTAGSYTVRTIASGCTSAASAATVVSVTPLPNTPSITAGGPTTFCAGGSVTLTAPAGFAYLWSTGATTQSISPTTAGSYTVRTIASGCTSAASAAMVVSVSPLPTGYTLTGPASACAGSNVTLTVTAGYARYHWSDNGGNGWFDNTNNTRVVSAISANTWIVRAVSADGCVGAWTSPISITVNPLPTGYSLTAPASACAGSNVTLTVTAGYARYHWSDNGGNGWFDNTNNTRVVSANSANTWIVRAVSADGCPGAWTSPVNITVNQLPSGYTLAGPANACAGSNVTLTVTAGYARYHWSDNGGGGWFDNTSNTRVVSASSATTWIVRPVTAAGCVGAWTSAISLTVNPLPSTPSVTAGGPTTFCAGGSVTLTAPAGFTYLWSTGATTQSISPTTAGSYTVRTISSGCTSAVSAATVVTVNPAPTASISASGTTICGTGSVILTAGGGTSYTWSPSTGLSATTGSVVTASPLTTTVYQVVATNANGCTDIETVTITVNGLPSIPTLSLSNGAEECAGNVISVANTLACPTCTYSWSGGGTGATKVVVAGANTFTVTAALPTGCNTTSQTVSVTGLQTGTWLGTTDSWSTAGNWCGGVPAAGANITLRGGVTNHPRVGNGTVQIGNLVLNGANLNMASGTWLQVAGNITGSGSILGSCNGSLMMNGSSGQQRIEVPVTLNQLSVSNSNGLKLTSNMTVCGAVNLVNGQIDATEANLVLTPTASNITETVTNRIVGTVTARGRTVGTGTLNMLGVTLGSGSDDLDTVYVQRRDEVSSYFTRNGIGATWSIRAHRQPTSGRQLTLSWTASMQNGKSFAAMQVWRRPDGTSTWLKVGSLQNRSAFAAAPYINVNTTGFSDWTVSDQNNPLPVTWLSFTGRRQSAKQVALHWTTAQEHQNAGFVIERSLDNIMFDSLGWVAGGGTITRLSQYEFMDGFSGKAYYRITQVDYDGKRSSSHVVFVTGEAERGLSLYPNPNHGKFTLQGIDHETLVSITTATGQTVHSVTIHQDGVLDISHLAAGVYFCQVGEQRIRFVKQ